ncbi:MAG: haloacid dehalogenase type II, partial [Betaproteobacteria bacterium]|nr:haloacid dehalogenase type II [Betaproteobacteria bacterium]
MTPASPLAPRAVLFDAYGTLFDVYSVAALAGTLFPGQGDALAALWRDKQIDYTRLLTLSGRYLPFWDVTRNALRYACKRLGLSLDAAQEAQLMQAYRTLQAFPEAKPLLEQLRGRDLRTGILSNGDPPMLDAAVRSAGLDGLIDPLLSVDAVGKFKTAPEAYALGPAALGLPAASILFVSSNCWDACCA